MNFIELSLQKNCGQEFRCQTLLGFFSNKPSVDSIDSNNYKGIEAEILEQNKDKSS
jgi:hypothetical protein